MEYLSRWADPIHVTLDTSSSRGVDVDFQPDPKAPVLVDLQEGPEAVVEYQHRSLLAPA